MGKSTCSKNAGLNKGKWTSEEDEILIKYIESNGEGSWSSLPKNAGLLRCGKSCRLRWINYLRGDLKRGNFTVEEDEMIFMLHNAFGSRWSMIASHLPGRTDNEIKNYWNSRLHRQSYRFFTNKNKANTSIDIATLVHQKKPTIRHVSRRVAKKYNESTSTSMYVTNKSNPPTVMIDEQVDGDCSHFLTDYMKESQVIDDVISDELEMNLLGFQDDEWLNMDRYLQDEYMDSGGVSSNIPDDDQLEKWLAEIEAENREKIERNVGERLSLNASKTLGVSCYDETEWDMENH